MHPVNSRVIESPNAMQSCDPVTKASQGLREALDVQIIKDVCDLLKMKPASDLANHTTRASR